MTEIDKFKENVDIYSADLSRWPLSDVKPAIAFMEANPVARAYFDEALKLDDVLRFYQPVPEEAAALAALEARIMAAIDRPSVSVTRRAMSHAQKLPAKVLSWRPEMLFLPGGGLIAAAVMGFLIGFTPAPSDAITLSQAPAYLTADQATAVDDIDDESMF